ncbi:GH25 family lysozyme [Streptomyces rhizosphaerihabitans]|uniref:GH25 family lysozyme n=1 Tax=Streptomyces rhizosphaerihabitans TaxID=1266770 RepID=UPI0021BE3E1A|nr:GH25 family lysozyme [Streptomyces rhizosphaerihabitans]MCT9004851.1 GH25 family lysozyme [Streptomyces rhizosphaerihabitans]
MPRPAVRRRTRRGVLHDARHFAAPDRSSRHRAGRASRTQRRARRADGWTLPPAPDVEYDPYGKHQRHGLGKAGMANRIAAFSDGIRRKTGCRSVICVTIHRWNTGTDSSRTFAADHTPWLARYGPAGTGALPAGRSRGPSGSTTTAAACRVTRISSTDPRLGPSGPPRDGDPSGARNSTSVRTRSLAPPTQAEGGFAIRDTMTPAPVHLPFIQVAYGPPATDVQQKPG